METTACKQNSWEFTPGEIIESCADREEAVVVIPLAVPVDQVELALVVPPIEVRHVAVAVDRSFGTYV